MRLIDADALIKALNLAEWFNLADFNEAVYTVRKAQPVDAVPVRHGRWETDGIMLDECEYLMTRCTACGGTYEYGFNMPFCPNCGADMRKNGEQHGQTE